MPGQRLRLRLRLPLVCVFVIVNIGVEHGDVAKATLAAARAFMQVININAKCHVFLRIRSPSGNATQLLTRSAKQIV